MNIVLDLGIYFGTTLWAPERRCLQATIIPAQPA